MYVFLNRLMATTVTTKNTGKNSVWGGWRGLEELELAQYVQKQALRN
jgi:hypothetical protein